MAKQRHPYFDAIFEELSILGQIGPKAIFGHHGVAIGSSIFAFFDRDALVVKTSRFESLDVTLPKGLRRFEIESVPSHTWIGIEFDDSLDALRKHWSLIEESYLTAVSRESDKAAKRTKARSARNKRPPR